VSPAQQAPGEGVPAFVEINGHRVDARYADLFRSGVDGSPISDDEWDEQIRRIREHEPDFTVPRIS
jgi:hypothetical protein